MSTEAFGELDFAPKTERTEFGPGHVEVDEALCDGCILCSVICAAGILEIVGKGKDKKVRKRPGQDNCMACACCEAICQLDAVRVVHGYDFGGDWKQYDRGGLSPPRPF